MQPCHKLEHFEPNPLRGRESGASARKIRTKPLWSWHLRTNLQQRVKKDLTGVEAVKTKAAHFESSLGLGPGITRKLVILQTRSIGNTCSFKSSARQALWGLQVPGHIIFHSCVRFGGPEGTTIAGITWQC